MLTCICRLLNVVLIGPNWPNGGEIDIVEGVHDYTYNQATIHTAVGCTIATSNSTTLAMLLAELIALLLRRAIKDVEFAQAQTIHLGLGSMPMAAAFMLVC